MTSYRCRYCQWTEDLSCEIIEKPCYVWNSTWRRLENLTAKMSDNQILFCLTHKYYFHDFQQNLKSYIQEFIRLIYFNSGGFLKTLIRNTVTILLESAAANAFPRFPFREHASCLNSLSLLPPPPPLEDNVARKIIMARTLLLTRRKLF